MKKLRGKLSNSRIWVALLSAISWMRWSRRRRERQRQEQWERDKRLLLEMQLQTRALLMEAMRPLAEALQRLDKRQVEEHQDLVVLIAEHRELLVEILQSQQPPAQQQIYQRIGPQAPMTSSRS